MELFKYFSAAGALRLFETGSLRFTQPAEFNDPFEMRPDIAGLAPADKIEQQFGERLNSELGDQLLTGVLDNADLTPDQRVSVSVERLRAAIIAHAPEALTLLHGITGALTNLMKAELDAGFNRLLGVLCLTEDPENLLMWPHYADEHRGAVVGFDSQHPFFNRRISEKDDLRQFRKVSYTRERPRIFLDRSEALEIFYFKSKDWEYEQEWRLIVPLADCAKRG